MSRRLIIDSLVYLVETYGVDGFRFDLAELLTTEVLREIETTLKGFKEDIILIAEPWSFRGNIAWELRTTGLAFWNDSFREFVAGYVRGRGDAEGLRYHLKGSTDHLAAFPAQSVNYVESHDDRCWIDKITENPDHDGRHPTPNDIRRTHMMAAILMCSLGIPMLAEGMDFLRSKHGVSNTYLRGDLNALDYGQIDRHRATHEYFRSWIALRNSTWGGLFRLREMPGKDYLRLFAQDGRSSAAVLFNADGSRGARQILLAVNPHLDAVTLDLPGIAADGWRELADHAKLDMNGLATGRLQISERRLRLEPLDCGLWARTG
jgi:pullulanase/glycogen debranching enzyme